MVTEWGKANLDVDKKFITVISEKHINDIEFLEYEIIKNREYSINHRGEILEYAQKFDWINVIKDIYVPTIEGIIK